MKKSITREDFNLYKKFLGITLMSIRYYQTPEQYDSYMRPLKPDSFCDVEGIAGRNEGIFANCFCIHLIGDNIPDLLG